MLTFVKFLGNLMYMLKTAANLYMVGVSMA